MWGYFRREKCIYLCGDEVFVLNCRRQIENLYLFAWTLEGGGMIQKLTKV
jgi:hypothetical protein